ncbi:hypothetical protein [Ilumatobacter sp.]|uniref:hypothetical protein n=1 Tax=Ilumatobacter sp. TaxID=1967498 RepID=UPI003B527410
MRLDDWSTAAVNLPEHADNPIHTDAGARAAGFAGALVAGVTIYAYLTHLPAVGWGEAWLAGGGAGVRFRQPVLDGERVDCTVDDPDPDPDRDVGGGDDGEVAHVAARVDGEARAEATFRSSAIAPSEADGPELDPVEFVVDPSWSNYGARAGDDCAIYAERSIAHPVTWPRIANGFCHDRLARGPWIHVRSDVVHLATAPVGSLLRARARVADRFDSRAGERAVLDVRISADGVDVAAVEHEAIIELASR